MHGPQRTRSYVISCGIPNAGRTVSVSPARSNVGLAARVDAAARLAVDRPQPLDDVASPDAARLRQRPSWRVARRTSGTAIDADQHRRDRHRDEQLAQREERRQAARDRRADRHRRGHQHASGDADAGLHVVGCAPLALADEHAHHDPVDQVDEDHRRPARPRSRPPDRAPRSAVRSRRSSSRRAAARASASRSGAAPGAARMPASAPAASAAPGLVRREPDLLRAAAARPARTIRRPRGSTACRCRSACAASGP